MKKILFTLLVLPFVLSCVFTGFGSGRPIRCNGPEESRSMEIEGTFTALEMNGGFDVELVNAADTYGVDVTANNDVFDWLKVYTRDGVLVIETKDNVTLMAEKFEITITAPLFRYIDVNGAVDLEYKDASACTEALDITMNGAGEMEIEKFAGPSMNITVNGAADIDITELKTGKISVVMNGAGDVKLTGEADDAALSVNGAGKIDASGLAIKNTPEVSKNGLAVIKLAKDR